jgi:hypothetical protein
MNNVTRVSQRDDEDDFENIPAAPEPFAQERSPDWHAFTIWENPTDRDCVLDLHVGTSPVFGPAEVRKAVCASWGKVEKTGHRRFVVPAKSMVRIPSEFDQGIQQTHCLETECTSRKAICRNPSHRMQIVGGYGPQLVNKRKINLREVSPALVAEPVVLQAPAAPATAPSPAGDAALARAQARRSGSAK